MDDLLEQLNRTGQRLVNLVRDVPLPLLRRKDGDEWAALEVLGHLRDREQVFSERIALLTSAAQMLPNWDEQAAAAHGRYLTEDPSTTVAEFLQLRHDNLERLATVADDVWERVAQHELQGPYSLRTEVERIAAHDEAHLRQIEALLGL